MDNLDTLFQKKEYESVISLVGDSKDPKERFLALSSLVILGKIDEALDQIDKYQSILEKSHLLQLMKIHFELLLTKKLYDEARCALMHYETLPYESQVVEEYMRETKARIDEEENAKDFSKMLSPDEVCETLENESDSGKLSNVLFSLKNYNINIYIDSLRKMLIKKEVHPNLRAYGLISLVDEKYNAEIDYLFGDKILKVNPSKTYPPFMSKEFNEVCKNIAFNADKNITITETALHLFNCYIIDMYPTNIYEGKSLENLALAFIYISKKYVNEKLGDVSDDVKTLADEIQKVLESTPQIVL